MKKRDFIIAIIVIAFGLLYNEFKSDSGDFQLRGCNFTPWHLENRGYPNDFRLDDIRFAPDSSITELEIDNPAGNIDVIKSTDGSIHVETIVCVYHKNKSKAEKIFKEIHQEAKVTDITTTSPTTDSKWVESPSTTANTKKLTIDIRPGEDFPYKRARVRYKVMIPETVELDLSNKYGNIQISDCSRPISIDNKYGDIAAKNILAPITIHHSYGNATLADIKNTLDLTSRYSSTRLYNISKLKLSTSYSKIIIRDVENETDIPRAIYSTISLENGRKVNIDSRQTRITLNNIRDAVNIKSSYERVSLTHITGNINVSGRDCRILLEKINSDEIVIRNSYDNVKLYGISARNADLLIEHGDLDAVFERIDERINIKNSYSDIKIAYPKSYHPYFALDLTNGRLKNYTTADLTTVNERGRITVNAGNIESKPQVIINNSYGSVVLLNEEPPTLPNIQAPEVPNPQPPQAEAEPGKTIK